MYLNISEITENVQNLIKLRIIFPEKCIKLYIKISKIQGAPEVDPLTEEYKIFIIRVSD